MTEFYDSISDFIFVENAPEKADIIFVPGGRHGEIAVNAATLYHQGYADKVLISGKYSILSDSFAGPLSPAQYTGRSYPDECSFLAAVMTDLDVPNAAIWCENEATFTYENACNSKALTDALDLTVTTAIISCQAYHARRCLLYYQLVYPHTRFLICPSKTSGITKETWALHTHSIDVVLGELERCGSQFHDILKNRLSSNA